MIFFSANKERKNNEKLITERIGVEDMLRLKDNILEK